MQTNARERIRFTGEPTPFIQPDSLRQHHKVP